MQNFLNYIRLEGEQTFNILEELKDSRKNEHYYTMLFDIHFFYVVILALLHFRTPAPFVIDDSSWKNAAENFTHNPNPTGGGWG